MSRQQRSLTDEELTELRNIATTTAKSRAANASLMARDLDSDTLIPFENVPPSDRSPLTIKKNDKDLLDIRSNTPDQSKSDLSLSPEIEIDHVVRQASIPIGYIVKEKEIVHLYENQRRVDYNSPWIRPYLKNDFPAYSDESGKISTSPKSFKLDENWIWLDEKWHIDFSHGGDNDGWLYRTMFSSPGPFHEGMHNTDNVRRRKWIRTKAHLIYDGDASNTYITIDSADFNRSTPSPREFFSTLNNNSISNPPSTGGPSNNNSFQSDSSYPEDTFSDNRSITPLDEMTGTNPRATPPLNHRRIVSRDDQRKEKYWQQVLDSWSEYISRNSGRLKDRLRQGIVHTLRGKIWQKLCQSDVWRSSTGKLYTTLAFKRADTDAELATEEFLSQWEQDNIVEKKKYSVEAPMTVVTPRVETRRRTEIIKAPKSSRFAHEVLGATQRLQQIKISNPSKRVEAQAVDILRRYSIFKPEVGFVQILKTFLCRCLEIMNSDEEDVFWFLERMLANSRLSSSTYPQGFYSLYDPGEEMMREVLYVHDGLVKMFVPQLLDILNSLHITSAQYAGDWYSSLFSTFPNELFYRIMDIFLNEGMKILFRFAICACRHASGFILQNQNALDPRSKVTRGNAALKLLEEIPNDPWFLKTDEVFKSIFAIRMKTKDITTLQSEFWKKVDRTPSTQSLRADGSLINLSNIDDIDINLPGKGELTINIDIEEPRISPRLQNMSSPARKAVRAFADVVTGTEMDKNDNEKYSHQATKAQLTQTSHVNKYYGPRMSDDEDSITSTDDEYF